MVEEFDESFLLRRNTPEPGKRGKGDRDRPPSPLPLPFSAPQPGPRHPPASSLSFLLSCCPSFPPSFTTALRAGTGCPRRRACPRRWPGLGGSLDGSRGTRGRAGHGAGSRGNIPFPLTGGLCRNGDGLLYLPLFARTPPSLSSGQERGEGVQDCAPRPHGPWAEALEELRKKGLSQRSPIFGAELLPDKARNGPQESDASRGSPLA